MIKNAFSTGEAQPDGIFRSLTAQFRYNNIVRKNLTYEHRTEMPDMTNAGNASEGYTAVCADPGRRRGRL